jgi:hypothetical protein
MNAVLASKPDFEYPQLATRHELAMRHLELMHETRMLKGDMDHRFAMLLHAADTQRQCILALTGALVISSFCMLLALIAN